LISKANDEEKHVEILGSEGKLNRKSIIFTARVDDIIKMKSIGNVGVDDITSDAIYVKEKEKQAQIVGPLPRRTSDHIILNFENEIKVITGNPSNKLTGCSILYNGEILFSEHNLHHNTDRVTLNDSYGNFIRTVWTISRNSGLVYDVTSIDTNTIAVSCDNVIVIVNIDSQNMYIVNTIQNEFRCYGISHYDGKLYCYYASEGIRRFDLKTKTKKLLVPTNIGPFSYISCDGNKLLYTSSTETVNCCDLNGKSIWKVEDTAVLRSPRGVVVDKPGFRVCGW
jgi:hypothetical protein